MRFQFIAMSLFVFCVVAQYSQTSELFYGLDVPVFS